MKVVLHQNYVTGGWDVWFVEEHHPVGTRSWVARPVSLVFEEVSAEGGEVPPTMSFRSRDFGEDLARGLQEARVQPPAASFVEGELVGTKLHLQDLRSLLGLGKA
jgi:hypothetical protein